MQLHSKELEASILAKARHQLRANRGQRRKRREHRSSVRRQKFSSLKGFSRFLVPWIGVLGVVLLGGQSNELAVQFGWLAFLMFAWMFIQAYALNIRLWFSPEIQAFALLPASDPLIFRWVLQRWLLSFWKPLSQLLIAVTALAVFLDWMWWQLVPALFLALLQTAICAWLAVLLVRRRWAVMTGYALSIFVQLMWFGLLLVSFFNKQWVGQAGTLFSGFWWFLTLPPFGWIWMGLERWLNGTPMMLLVIPATAALSLLGWPWFRALARSYKSYTVGILDRHGESGELDRDWAGNLDGNWDGKQAGDRRESIENDLQPASAPAGGWMNRLLYGWMTPRQRLLKEFVHGELPDYSRKWRSRVKWLVIGMAGALLLNGVTAGTAGFLFGMLWLVFGGQFFIPILQDGNPGSHSAWSGTRTIPSMILVPFSLREWLPVHWKTATLRALAGTIPLSLAASCLASMAGKDWLMGLTLAIKAELLSVAVSPMLCILAFSSFSSKARFTGWRTIGTLVLLLIYFVALVAVGMTLMLPFPVWAHGLALAGATAISLLWFKMFLFFFNRCWVDLLHQPETD